MPALLAALLFLALSPAHASVPVSLRYLEDKSASLDLASVMADRGGWKPVEHEVPSFGQTYSRIWFRFTVPREKLVYPVSEPFFVEITSSYLEHVGLYKVVDGKVTDSMAAGLDVPLSRRAINVLRAGFSIFRLSAPHEDGAEYFVSIEGRLPLSLPLTVWEAPELPFHHWLTMLLVGMCLGCLLLAVLYNGFLGVSLRNSLYGYYALFVFSMILIILTSTGLSVQLLWPEAPWWSVREMLVVESFGFFFYVQFVRTFLESRKVSPLLDRVLLICVAISFLRSAWLCVAYQQEIAVLGDLASGAGNIIGLVVGAKALRTGARDARYFFLASLSFNVTIVLFIFQEVNLVWIGPWMAWAPFLGTMIEVVLLSLALGDRIRQTNMQLAAQNAAMVQAEKLSALGRMAGEIAHEISNPLAIIHGNAVLVGKEADQPHVREFGATIENTANRLSKLVKGMRALSRDSRRDPFQRVSLDSILQDAQALCGEKARQRGIAVDLPAPNPELQLRCRGSEICQVMVNLLSNALDAAEGQALPLVKVEAARRGKLVEISVSDNGRGVPPEIRGQILEPFFTTKEAGKGLGLGLSISRTIVETHGGALWLDEHTPHTRFTFTVPASS